MFEDPPPCAQATFKYWTNSEIYYKSIVSKGLMHRLSTVAHIYSFAGGGCLASFSDGLSHARFKRKRDVLKYYANFTKLQHF